MRNWKAKFQLYAWDLIMYKIYQEGLKYKAENLVIVATKVGLTKSYLYHVMRKGSDGFNPDCDTIHKILSKYDPVMDVRFMFHPKNIWSMKRARTIVD